MNLYRRHSAEAEFYYGFSQSKLYKEVAKGNFRNVSIGEPGQVKGAQLFLSPSILKFMEECEARAAAGGDQ